MFRRVQYVVEVHSHRNAAGLNSGTDLAAPSAVAPPPQWCGGRGGCTRSTSC